MLLRVNTRLNTLMESLRQELECVLGASLEVVDAMLERQILQQAQQSSAMHIADFNLSVLFS